MKSSRRRKLIAIIAAFCVAFTSLPMLTGSIDVQAASGKVKINTKTVTAKVAKKKAKKAKTIYLGAKVRKIKPGAFKSCKKAKTLVVQTKKLKKSSVKGSLKASKIKAIKVNVGSPAENKKYAKKYKAFFTKKNAGKAIKVSVMKTATASSGEAAAGSQASSTSGSTPSGTTPSGTDPGTGGQTPSTDPGTGAETKTMTDYLGVTRTATKVKDSAGYWWETADGAYISDKDLAKWDRTVDGEFAISGGTVMKQVGGVTFVKNQLSSHTPDEINNGALNAYSVEMYNGDLSKLQLEVQNPMTEIHTYSREKVPYIGKYIVKDGFFLCCLNGVKEEQKQNYSKKTIMFQNLEYATDRCGFVSGDVVIKIKYNNSVMGEIRHNPNPNADSRGLHPKRQIYYDIVKAAIDANGGYKSYTDDWHAIRDYIQANYTYNQRIEKYGTHIVMDCIGGAKAMETYSIYFRKAILGDESVYGFFSYGSAIEGTPNHDTHVAFHLDSDPEKYYQTQGK